MKKFKVVFKPGTLRYYSEALPDEEVKKIIDMWIEKATIQGFTFKYD